MIERFHDRREAGRLLASRLESFAGRSDVIVLGLARGGVPVAYEIALALDAPLEVFVVRKLGVPRYEEVAMGAIATGGVRVLNMGTIHQLGIPPYVVESVTAAEQRELARREEMYRGSRPAPDLRHRTVIVVDDGLATGSTMHAAVAAIRELNPARVIVAAPVGTADTVTMMRRVADDCICFMMVHSLDGVGRWYDDFTQTTDAEVTRLLEAAQRRLAVRDGPLTHV
jgi:predicted phosphoribosyltransferase